MTNTLRPSWDAYFMSIAHIVQSRSNCIRGARGAILTKDKRIVTTGYNGTPSGVKDCDEGGCTRCQDRQTGKIQPGERKDLCICVHAEQNALIQAAYHGVPTKGTALYSTVSPCTTCAKAIINAGVVEVIYDDEHSDDFGEKLLIDAGVKVRKFV